MGAGVAANPHCPVPSAEPGWATASSPGFRVARGAEAPRGPAGSLFQGIAAFASGSPAGSSFRSIAAPASGSLRFLDPIRHRCPSASGSPGSSSDRHCCLPGSVPSGSLFGSIAAPASGPLAGSSFQSIAAPSSGSLEFLSRHRCPSGSRSGRLRGIAASPGSLRRPARPESLACRRLRLPGPKASGSAGLAGKWERHRPEPLPHASSLFALPSAAFVPPPFQASAGTPLRQPPGAFFGPEPGLLVSGRSRPHREADRLSDSRLAQSTCG